VSSASGTQTFSSGDKSTSHSRFPGWIRDVFLRTNIDHGSSAKEGTAAGGAGQSPRQWGRLCLPANCHVKSP